MAAENGGDTTVSRWFGPAFGHLHPLLQTLHRYGGRLQGPVAIRFGRGVAGMLGRRLARRLGIPRTGRKHALEVVIAHDEGALRWTRRFDDGQVFASVFRPYGHWPQGGWIEDTSVIALMLQVDVIDGGWYWRCVGARRGSTRVPRWLLPRSQAHKRIEDGRYRFEVSFALPLVGEVLRYGGLLEAVA